MNVPDHDAVTTSRRDFDRVSAAVVAAARALPTATLHEAGGKIGALPSIIKPVAAAFRCCGPATTVHSPGGDNLWLHRALDIAQPGDVLVVHVSGAYEHGYWGEIMTTMAKARGLAGLVIEGCVRDEAAICRRLKAGESTLQVYGFHWPAMNNDTTTPGKAPHLAIDGRVATITLRRPTVANRLDREDLQTLQAQLAEVNATSAVLVLRLVAEGRHFCSGFNIGQVGSGVNDGGQRFEALGAALERTRPVTIAAIQGGIYGGATDLALACDFRIGTPAAELSVPAAKLGLLFYRGGLERWVNRLGLATAKRVLLTAERLDSDAMLSCGYLDRLAPSVEALQPWLDELTTTLAGMAPLALLGMKKHLNRIAAGRLIEDEFAVDIAEADASADLSEGALAWKQKRDPRFQGR